MTTTKPKLIPEIKERWLAALRSGEYHQGTGYLHYQAEGVDRFCCLGVLCDLAVRAGVIGTGEAEELDAGHDATFRYGDSAESMPPPPVTRWAFGADPQVLLLNDGVWDVPTPAEVDDSEPPVLNLATLNDDHGFSFEGIASVIQASL